MSETPRRDETERDSRLAALYRATTRDEPQPALDAAIRAAARREVGARPRPVGPLFSRSWRVPLSIAAVVLLSVSLVTVIREEAPPEISQPPRADASLPLPEAAMHPRKESVAAEAKVQPRSEAASADSAVRESSRARVQAAPAVAPHLAPQMAGAIHAYANLPPEKWLEQIEALRKQGRLEEAKTSLAHFKQRYPDHPLPASLKDGVKP
jgi:hypothetical protein